MQKVRNRLKGFSWTIAIHLEPFPHGTLRYRNRTRVTAQKSGLLLFRQNSLLRRTDATAILIASTAFAHRY